MQWNREVDRAIVSNVPEAEIGRIKKEYITDRIKASVDTFGSQTQLYGNIITAAVAVLALLVSKVLRKVAELSEPLPDTRQKQDLSPEPSETIFEAEKERNALEDNQSSLKGLSKLTKKGELQSEIDRINERIDLLKVGLSSIAKRYGYQTVQDFYRSYHAAKNAYADYQEKVAKWEETYGTKPKGETKHDRIQSYQREESALQSKQTTQRKGKGAR